MTLAVTVTDDNVNDNNDSAICPGVHMTHSADGSPGSAEECGVCGWDDNIMISNNMRLG